MCRVNCHAKIVISVFRSNRDSPAAQLLGLTRVPKNILI